MVLRTTSWGTWLCSPLTPQQEISLHMPGSSGRLYAMVDKVGETMTMPSANREQQTTPSYGITSSPDCRRQLSSGKDRGRVQHFVPYEEVLITFGPRVRCSTFSHLLVGPHLLILSWAPSGTSVCPGTRVHASSPPAAPIGTYALPVSFSTRQKTAPAHLKAPFLNAPNQRLPVNPSQ